MVIHEAQTHGFHEGKICTFGFLSRTPLSFLARVATLQAMRLDESPSNVEELEREVVRLSEDRHELFSRLIEVESERTAQTMELLTMAAHELRTPLQSLVMGTDLMVDRLRGGGGGDDDATRKWLLDHLARQQATLGRMQELMRSWLSAPQLRAGTLPAVSERLDLAELVRQVVERYETELAWAGCPVELELEPAIGNWDRMRLDAVVSNLVSNAIKYGAGQPIHVSVKREDGAAAILVRDRGNGIAAADQSRIFERFERASAPSRVPGFGIGLWMTRALLRAIGGTVGVESAPGVGSTFTVRLPSAAHE
jgi:signal transduction histidine kinase